jgi:hypothetical protein
LHPGDEKSRVVNGRKDSFFLPLKMGPVEQTCDASKGKEEYIKTPSPLSFASKCEQWQQFCDTYIVIYILLCLLLWI